MDILYLVDRLEELFNESRSMWLSHKVLINEDRMLDLIDQMRLAIPDEIKKAQKIINQKDRILAQAQEKANRTIAQAREKSVQMIERDVIVENAKALANGIKQKTLEDCNITKREAEQYSIDTLDKLEHELEHLLTQVQNGIHALEEELTPNTQKDER